MIVTGDSVNSMVDRVDEKKIEDPFVSCGGCDGEPESVSMNPKPFFFMDWLEKIIPTDLEFAQQFLQTPNKQMKPEDTKHLVEAVPRELFTSEPKSKMCNVNTPSHREKSYFYKKSITIGNAWNAKGLQKAQKDRWEEALLCWQNALEVRLQILGEDHLDVANTYNNIGIAQGKIGFYDEAIKSLHVAQDIRKRYLGEEHTEVAATLHNIGNVYQQSGEFLKAVEYFQLSKQLQSIHLGSDHVQVARAAIAIGHAYFQAAKWEESLEAYIGAMKTLRLAGIPEDDDEIIQLKEDVQDVEDELNRSV